MFPISLDTDHPAFRAGLERLFVLQTRIDAAKKQGGLIGKLKQAVWSAAGLATFVRLYCMPVHHHELPVNVRVAPAW